MSSRLTDLHLGRRLGACRLKLFIRNPVGNKSALKGYTTGLKLVGAPGILAIDKAHEFGGCIAVVVWGTVGVTRDIPSRAEYEEICEGCGRIARRRCKDTEDGWVDVVHCLSLSYQDCPDYGHD